MDSDNLDVNPDESGSFVEYPDRLAVDWDCRLAFPDSFVALFLERNFVHPERKPFAEFERSEFRVETDIEKRLFRKLG